MSVKSFPSALVPCQPGEAFVNYPTRPVDTTTDFEGTTNMQQSQPGCNHVGAAAGRTANVGAARIKGAAAIEEITHGVGILGFSHAALVFFSPLHFLIAFLFPLLRASFSVRFMCPIFCDSAAHHCPKASVCYHSEAAAAIEEITHGVQRSVPRLSRHIFGDIDD
ncbi:cyclin-dependent kinase [Trifolium pratense]|uniref:Cyclin-dependent kinase n=1 Tax=Trifolium pratense TaxID=57577 RepID=A0A2K3NTP0_TRIPR|nr:cyclin-dependent kinase [Trifolium pratense]